MRYDFPFATHRCSPGTSVAGIEQSQTPVLTSRRNIDIKIVVLVIFLKILKI